MYQSPMQDIEVSYRQSKIRADYIHSQRQISVGGLRQILGNTIIEMGSRIHGVAQGSCTDAAEIRGMVRSAMQSPLHSEPGG